MRLLGFLLLMLLTACEQKFDDQYAETEKQLKADAARLDREMAEEALKEPGETARRQ